MWIITSSSSIKETAATSAACQVSCFPISLWSPAFAGGEGGRGILKELKTILFVSLKPLVGQVFALCIIMRSINNIIIIISSSNIIYIFCGWYISGQSVVIQFSHSEQLKSVNQRRISHTAVQRVSSNPNVMVVISLHFKLRHWK